MSLPSFCNLIVCLLFTAACLVLFAFPETESGWRLAWQVRCIFGVIGCSGVQVFIHWREGGYNEPKAMPKTQGFDVVTRKDENR